MRALSDDIRELGILLGEVLGEQAGGAAFHLVEELRQTVRDRRRDGRDTADVGERFAALSPAELGTKVRAFSLYFLITNLAEEHERVRRRQARGCGQKQTLHEALRARRHRHIASIGPRC